MAYVLFTIVAMVIGVKGWKVKAGRYWHFDVNHEYVTPGITSNLTFSCYHTLDRHGDDASNRLIARYIGIYFINHNGSLHEIASATREDKFVDEAVGVISKRGHITYNGAYSYLNLTYKTTTNVPSGIYLCNISGLDYQNKYQTLLKQASIKNPWKEDFLGVAKSIHKSTEVKINSVVYDMLELISSLSDTVFDISRRLDTNQNQIKVLDYYDPTVTWPSGRYWLPRPKTGCPTTPTTEWEWGTFQIRAVMEDMSVNANLDVDVYGDRKWPFVAQGTCAKVSGEEGVKWPKGSYCIGMYDWVYGPNKPCEDEFKAGSVLISKDPKSRTSNIYARKINGDGMTLYFCCRNDKPANQPITLPAGMPFFLYRYKGECQHVHDMMHSVVMVVRKLAIPNSANNNINHPDLYLNDHNTLSVIMCFYTPLNL